MSIVLLNENILVREHFHPSRVCTQNTNSLKQDLVLWADIFLKGVSSHSRNRMKTVEILKQFLLVLVQITYYN